MQRSPRSTDLLLVAGVWAASVVGCGCGGAISTGDGGSDAAAGDAGVDALVEAGVDASTLDCDGEFAWFSYVFDGVAEVSGCVPGDIGTTVYLEPFTQRVRTLLSGVPGDRSVNWPMPELVCGTGLTFDNTPFETGASGELELDFVYAYPPPTSAHVTLPLAYNPDPMEGLLCGRSDNIWAMQTGGTWHVLQGGSSPGDWVDVEARDVTFAPMAGHTLRFDRMRWRVQLGEPVIVDIGPSVDGGSGVADAGIDAGLDAGPSD